MSNHPSSSPIPTNVVGIGSAINASASGGGSMTGSGVGAGNTIGITGSLCGSGAISGTMSGNNSVGLFPSSSTAVSASPAFMGIGGGILGSGGNISGPGTTMAAPPATGLFSGTITGAPPSSPSPLSVGGLVAGGMQEGLQHMNMISGALSSGASSPSPQLQSTAFAAVSSPSPRPMATTATSSSNTNSAGATIATGTKETPIDVGIVPLLKLVQMPESRRSALALGKDPTLLGWDGDISLFFSSSNDVTTTASSRTTSSGVASAGMSAVTGVTSGATSPVPTTTGSVTSMNSGSIEASPIVLKQQQLHPSHSLPPQARPPHNHTPTLSPSLGPGQPTSPMPTSPATVASSSSAGIASMMLNGTGGARSPVQLSATAEAAAAAAAAATGATNGMNGGESLSNNNATPGGSINPKLQQLVQHLPNCYLMTKNGVAPPPLTVGHFAKFTLETLMYMFYNNTGDVLQMYAAMELYKRNWRYHSTLKLWFQKTSLTTNDLNVFDARTWTVQPTPPGTMTPALLQGLLSEDEIRVQPALVGTLKASSANTAALVGVGGVSTPSSPSTGPASASLTLEAPAATATS